LQLDMIRRRHVVFCGSLLLGTAWAGDAMPAAERSRVERLIKYVESRTDVQFIRNGTAYSSQDAASFLRGKMDQMGEGVMSARQFIEQIASRSTMSGQPYMIRYPDGRTEYASKFLGDELKRIDAAR
jgi:hypothetical protein